MWRGRRITLLGALALVAATGACGSGTPGAEEAVIDATPTATPSTTTKPRKPRPTAKAYGGIDVSETFPKGLDWVHEPPPELTPTPPGDASPTHGAEGEPLAVKLAENVLASGTKLVASGPTIVMQVLEGTTIAVLDPMQPGGCYGAYAIGDAGIAELDLEVKIDPTALAGGGGTVPALPPVAIAKDTDTGGIATLGVTSGNCFRMPIPIPLPTVVRVTAKTGSGLVAVQLLKETRPTP